MSTSKGGPSGPTQLSGITVGVRYFDTWYDSDAANATGARGQALLDEGRIMIDPKLPRDVQALTLLHESIHCAFEQSPLTAGKAVKDADVEVNEVLEEKLCTWLEAVIPQLYRDNRQLFEELP